MESHCISLLEEIQAEVAQYVIDNIWSRGGESYNRFCEEISKRKPNKFIGCILNTKKPNDEKHMMFSFQLLSENTYMVSEKLVRFFSFFYVPHLCKDVCSVLFPMALTGDFLSLYNVFLASPCQVVN